VRADRTNPAHGSWPASSARRGRSRRSTTPTSRRSTGSKRRAPVLVMELVEGEDTRRADGAQRTATDAEWRRSRSSWSAAARCASGCRCGAARRSPASGPVGPVYRRPSRTRGNTSCRRNRHARGRIGSRRRPSAHSQCGRVRIILTSPSTSISSPSAAVRRHGDPGRQLRVLRQRDGAVAGPLSGWRAAAPARQRLDVRGLVTGRPANGLSRRRRRLRACRGRR
jgi:hypothetical protein